MRPRIKRPEPDAAPQGLAKGWGQPLSPEEPRPRRTERAGLIGVQGVCSQGTAKQRDALPCEHKRRAHLAPRDEGTWG